MEIADYRSEYGFEACMDSVKFSVEKLNANPIHLLGEYTLRAKQDICFNKTMIDALMAYIDQNGIRWNGKKGY